MQSVRTAMAPVKITFALGGAEWFALFNLPLSQRHCGRGSGPWIKRHYLMRGERDGCSM